MSATIDERVVEMRFDNDEFERGTRQTMKSLDDLKKSLDFSGVAGSFSEIDRAANSVSLSGIHGAVKVLEERFSTLGVVGMTVVSNLTTGIMDLIGKMATYVKESVVVGGLNRAQNIENAHFQLQALLKDEEEVQKIMTNANDSVTGTAYAYDEAAKAASQFAASGVKSGKEMEEALVGITGVAAMTSSDYESIARIFTTVAGNGRLMGDQLLQLSSRGLNAASTIAEYFRTVKGQSEMTEATVREMVSDGEISFKTFAKAMNWAFGESAFRANETFTGAMANMKAAFSRIGAGFYSPLIEQNSDLVGLINTVRESINKVKATLVFDEQASAIQGLADKTGMTTESLEKMWKKMTKSGTVSIKQINKLANNGVGVVRSLTDYINGVNDGTIRATYATKTALTDLTGGLAVDSKKVKKYVKQGKISITEFTSAMEYAYGNQDKASNKFTDTVLDMSKKVTKYISEIDVEPIMDIAYDGLTSITNVFKGLGSIAKPVAKAFKDVFLTFKVDDVKKLSSSVVTLTSKFKLSEKASSSLNKVFVGLFSVIKSLGGQVVKLIDKIRGIETPTTNAGDKVADLADDFGETLIKASEWIDKSDPLVKAFDAVSGIAKTAADAIKTAYENIKELAGPVVEQAVGGVQDLVTAFANSDAVTAFGDLLKKVFGPEVTYAATVDSIRQVNDGLNAVNPQQATDALNAFNAVAGVTNENLGDLEGYANDVSTAVAGVKDSLASKDKDEPTFIDKIKDKFSKFVEFYKSDIKPFFSNLTLGGLLAAASGIITLSYVLKGFDKIGTLMDKMSKVLDGLNIVPDLKAMLQPLQDTLVTYQKKIKSEAFINIAKAIAIFAGSLLLLSFADVDKLRNNGAILAGFTLLVGLLAERLMTAFGNMQTASDSAEIVSQGLADSARNLTKSVKIRAIGKMIRDIAISLGVAVAAIILLAKTYNDNPESIENALDIIKKIAIGLGVIIGVSTLVMKLVKSGGAGVKNAANAMLSISAAIFLIVLSIQRLLDMDLPSDFDTKLGLFELIIVDMAGLLVAIGLMNRVAGKYAPEGFSKPILAMAVAFLLITSALKKVFSLEIGPDWIVKISILEGALAGLAGLILAVGLAGRLSKGNTKFASTILAMCAAIVVIVGALSVLSITPVNQMLLGAVGLGIVLLTLGIALGLLGTVKSQDAYKSVLAMAVTIAAITASLGVLSIIPWEKLRGGAIALGGVLLALAVVFHNMGGEIDKLNLVAIGEAIAAIAVIAASLYFLAEQPWESILAGGAALAAVLLSMAGSMAIVANTSVSKEAILEFLGMTISVLLIAAAIRLACGNPWEEMLAAGASISAVLLALAGAFKIISDANIDVATILEFLAGICGVGLIGEIIKGVATSASWEQLLSAAGSITMVLIGMTLAMAVCALVGNFAPGAAAGIVLLDAFIADLAGVLYVLGSLKDQTKEIMDNGGDVLLSLGSYLGMFIGNIIEGIGNGIANTLPNLGTALSEFALNATPFFVMMKTFNPDIAGAAKALAQTILYLTASDLITGIMNLFGIGDDGFADLGEQMAALGEAVGSFAEKTKDVNSDTLTAASYCAEIVTKLIDAMPSENGWVQKIFGDKTSLGDFSDQLTQFGIAMVSFSDTVDGKIKQEAVDAAVNAAKIVTTFAEELPSDGGLLGDLFGGQIDLAEFSNQLWMFAAAIVNYSECVKGNKFSDTRMKKIEASIQAATMLAGLEDSLGTTGGLFSIFTGDNGLDDFGSNLEKFGGGLAAFAEDVDDIDTAQLSHVITQVTRLAQMSKTLESVDTEAIATFGSNLKKMGDNSVEKFVKAFTDCDTLVEQAILTMLSYANDALDDAEDDNSKSFKTYGEDLVDALIEGMTGKKQTIFDNVKEICDKVVGKYKEYLPASTFKTIGENASGNVGKGVDSGKSDKSLLTNISSFCSFVIGKIKDGFPSSKLKDAGAKVPNGLKGGINNKSTRADMKNAASDLTDAAIDKVKDKMDPDEFNTIGANAIQGLINGMNIKKPYAEKAAKEVANAIPSKVKYTLAEKSPSKVMKKIGEYATLGLSQGLVSKMEQVKRDGENLANASTSPFAKAIETLATMLDDTIDEYAPTIRPVLDLSGVENGASSIPMMLPEMPIVQTVALANDATATFESSRFGRTLRSNQSLDEAESSTPVDNSTNITNNNTFNIKSSDPKQAANEVDYILQHRAERGKATWGR